MFNRVFLTLKGQHDGQNIIVEALEVPSICTITSPPVSKEIVRAMADQGQVAADARLAPTFRDNQVSVLIASDAYWKVATVNVSRISPTLMAVETVLGWTIQGTQLDSSRLSTTHSSALFLSLGESSTEDTTVDNDRSSMCRLEVSETRGTTENSTFNDPAIQPFELQDRKENHRDQVLLRNEEPRSEVANQLSFQKVKLDFKTKRSDPCIMKVLGTQWKGSDSLVLREDNITMFVSEKPVAKSEAMPAVPSALLAKQREHVPPAETLPSRTLVDWQRAAHTVTAPSSRQGVSSVAPSDMGIPPAASIHPRGDRTASSQARSRGRRASRRQGDACRLTCYSTTIVTGFGRDGVVRPCSFRQWISVRLSSGLKIRRQGPQMLWCNKSLLNLGAAGVC
ncbi:hypothetical protein HPB48_012623 [Haemaphysalis longicornis]|uniref:Peptidase aspartic putative domain-containing protein n=1 Tax=Haemaphysalis longicornis TaxID=44386 RepID=A0A9J6G062_HAELO|nr:hypothetical protein HPB48_012623 [Haemaphysalis longicornis]